MGDAVAIIQNNSLTDFNSFLVELATEMVRPADSEIDEAINTWLQKISEFYHCDLVRLLEFDENRNGLQQVYSYVRRGTIESPHATTIEYPWLLQQLQTGATIAASSLADLPEAASLDREVIAAKGISEFLVAPMIVGSNLLGAICVGYIEEKRHLNDFTATGLKQLADVFANIITRKHTGWQLEQKDSFFRGLFYNSPDIIVLTNSQGIIETINYAPEGYKERQLRGCSFADLLDENSRTKFENRIAYAIQTREPQNCEVAVALSPATTGTWFLRILPLIQDKQLRLIINCTNITARKYSELAILESAEKFRSLFDNMINGFALHEIILDDNGNPVDCIFLEVNRAHEKLTGLTRNHVIGRRLSEILPGMEAELRSWLERFGKVALTGDPIRFEDYFSPLGKWFHVNAYCPKHGQFAIIFEDATEQKLTEEKLRHSEEEYRQLYLKAGIGIGLWTVDGRTISMNEVALKTMGKTQSEIEGKSLYELFPTAEADVFMQRIQQVAENDQPAQFVDQIDLENTHRWFLSTYSAVKSARGEIRSVQIVSNDITKRKLAELELEKKKNLLDSMERMAKIGGWEFDVASGKFELTDGMYLLTELPIGSPSPSGIDSALTFHPPEEHDCIRSAFARAIDDGTPFDLELKSMSSTGRHHWIRTQSHAIRENGKTIRLIGTHQDITDRKEAELALRKSGQKLRAHLNSTPVAVIEWDDQLRASFWNQAAEQIFGYSWKDVIGKCVKDLKLAGNLADQLSDVFENLRGRNGVYNSVSENMTKDGQQIVCDWHHMPIRGEKDRVIGVASIAMEVTELVRARTEIERKNIALQEVLRQIEHEKEALEKSIQANIDSNLMPALNRMYRAANRIEPIQVKYLMDQLSNIAEPFISKLKSLEAVLTPHEVEICNLIRAGNTTKEVARIMNLSTETIKTHRSRIRRKIGKPLGNKSLNDYLQMI